MDAEVIATIGIYVNASFYSQSQILDIICDEIYASDELSHINVEKIVEEKIRLKSIEEKKWPKLTHNDLLDKFFKKLNKAGIIALQNVENFASGLDEVTDIFQNQDKDKIKGNLRGFCFYQWQDTEVAINGGGLRFSYGDLNNNKEQSAKIGCFIFEEIKKTSLKPDWSGDQEKKIYISNFKWRKRFKFNEKVI